MKVINVGGNLDSLKASIIDELEEIYSMYISAQDFVPKELAEKLAYLTGRTNREIAVYLNRKGRVLDVSIGDSSTVSLCDVEGKRSRTRLSGIRCIHTHPNGSGKLSAVDINSLLKLRLDAMTALGVAKGKITEIYTAIPGSTSNAESDIVEIFGPCKIENSTLNSLFTLINEMDKKEGAQLYLNKTEKERCVLVGLEIPNAKTLNGKTEAERSLDELEELARTAGAVVVKKIVQKKKSSNSAYYIGKGKLEEISLIIQALNADTIIFDHELSGAQIRNIEDITGAKVIDRTSLILDIFSTRAKTREGKLQVELAQLKYRLPRLSGLGNKMSRLGGGIGTRGPGEKKLETDRRYIRGRIKHLEKELESLAKRREFARIGRKKNNVPSIALVGYTNAGKSTLINTLCNSKVFAEDKLFATLDPTTRKLTLPDGRDVLLTDTVGFIRKLPHDLIEAFRSTLEEVVHADVLIHVVDASDDELEEQIQVVNKTLNSLGAQNKLVLFVLNKIDLVYDRQDIPLINLKDKVYEVSAVTGEGIDELINGIAQIIPDEDIQLCFKVPYTEGWVFSHIHENGKVLEKCYKEDGIEIKAVMNKKKVHRLKQYTTS